jgi:predicted ATPase
MASMTNALLGTAEIPGDLRELIARKAEGNPFFVEEVTKSLLEEGALRRKDGRLELAQDIGAVSIPDRIQDVIMARIDRLPDDRKHAIQVASVIGREFVLRLLERITELGDAVGPLVDELRALELVYEKAAHPGSPHVQRPHLTWPTGAS